MANKKPDNKRVIFGAIFLLVLLGANLVVRLGRKTPAPRPLNPGETQVAPAIPQAIPRATPQATPQPAQSNFASLPAASGGSPGITSGGNEIDIQLEQLKNQLDLLKRDLSLLPPPHASPDLNVSLFLLRDNIFDFSLPTTTQPAIAQASETITAPIASMAAPLSLVGVFNQGGRKRLMVKRENKVYMVSENDMNAGAEFSLLSSLDGQYTVLDRQGQEHLLSLPEPVETNVDKVLKILKSSDQPSIYSIMDNNPETPAGAKSP